MDEKDHWLDEYTEREKASIRHALRYTEHYQDAAIPGHNQILLIAKLVRTVQELVATQTAAT